MENLNNDVCFICKHSWYTTICKGCIYDVLNSKNKKDDKKLNDNQMCQLPKGDRKQDG